ncbi:MAG: ATP-binding cassette domain-containing protein [Candidatus Zhuqueibacterota bacterium]
MIDLRDIDFEYSRPNQEKVLALHKVSLKIREGEYIVLMGHNSSGKTTLVRCLNGLLRPTFGQICVDDLCTASDADILAIRKKVGMVFQNPDNQLVSTTVEREIAFGLENLGVPTETIHHVITAILERFHLTPYRKYPPHLLSGGEKQKVALASILAMNPKYLILDEPTSMLDPQSRRELLSLLSEIKTDNREKKTTEQITIILVTQFPEEALHADRLIVLEKGSIIFDDQPEIVFRNVAELKSMGLEVPPEFEILPLLLEKGISSDVLKGFK